MLAKFHIRGNLTFKFANLGPTWSQLGSILGGFKRCLSGVEAILDANITINILIIVILSVILSVIIIILTIIMTGFSETKSLENSRNSDYVLVLGSDSMENKAHLGQGGVVRCLVRREVQDAVRFFFRVVCCASNVWRHPGNHDFFALSTQRCRAVSCCHTNQLHRGGR